MELWTDCINEQGLFDPRYTCDVDNSSPELRWSNPPEGTAGFALFFEDLDGPKKPFFHWLIYNIPANLSHLPAGIPPQDSLPNGILQGTNDLRKLGYSGPCPPRGSSGHRYVMRILALKSLPQLPSRMFSEQLLAALRDFIIASTEIHGRYQRIIERAAG